MYPQKEYKVSAGRLLELLENEARLQALEQGGVDNWEWYGESISGFLESCAIDYNLPKDISFKELAKFNIKNFEGIKLYV